MPIRTWMLALVVLLLGASTASAGTVLIDENELIVRAGPGEANDVRVVEVGEGAFSVRDAGAPLEAGTGCTSVSPHEALCQDEFFYGITVRLGDGNDRLDVTEACATDFCGLGHLFADAGSGADHMFGSRGLDSLHGSAGDDLVEGRGGAECSPRGGCWGDTLVGGRGDDDLRGGAGPDLLVADAGSDRLSGGTGFDTASYRTRRTPVRVQLDDRPNDGALGETGFVGPDVESVAGGLRDDTLVGNARRNALLGGGGHDVLDGRGGNDILDLGTGRDRARAGAGSDSVYAADRRRDVIDGGAGRDTAIVDPGVDRTVRVERLSKPTGGIVVGRLVRLGAVGGRA